MKSKITRTLMTIGLAGAMALGAISGTRAAEAAGDADKFPEESITIVVPFSAGSGTDVGARNLQKLLTKELGVNILIENVTGSGGWIGWTDVIKNSPADGYTMGMINHNFVTGAYDDVTPRTITLNDVELLCNQAIDYNVLAIRSNEDRFTDIPSFIEYAKKNDVLVTAQTSGITDGDASTAQWFNNTYGTKITIVPVDGASDGRSMLLAGDIDVYFASVGDVYIQRQSGELKPLCVFAPERSKFLPDVPTLLENCGVTSANRGETIAVDSLAPNGFGLYNMYGNVSEWCFDYYGDYDTNQTTDPAGPASGSLRVNRGGGWNDFAKQLRSAYRSATTPDTVEQNLGFRIARNAQPGEGVVETTYTLDIQTPEDPRILVAYFSHTGNTENGAQIIASHLGADLFEIQMAEPYRGNIYEVSQQDLNNNVYPALASHVENMEQYDVVILGYPTWWSTMPMPVFTFLEEYDFSGKVILPFSSNGGTRFGDSISDLSKMAPDAYVGQGFEYTYSGGSGLAGELDAWLASNGIGAE